MYIHYLDEEVEYIEKVEVQTYMKKNVMCLLWKCCYLTYENTFTMTVMPEMRQIKAGVAVRA